MEAQGAYGNGEVPYGQPSPHPILAGSGQDPATENDRLQAELQQMTAQQREIMELLNTRSPDKIIHDLRNLINELNLYRSLVESDSDA